MNTQKYWIGDPGSILNTYTFEEAIMSKSRWTSDGSCKFRGIRNHDTRFGDGLFKIHSYKIDGVDSDKYKDFVGFRVDAGSIALVSDIHYNRHEVEFNYGIEIEAIEQPYFNYRVSGDWGVFDIIWTDSDNHRHEIIILT